MLRHAVGPTATVVLVAIAAAITYLAPAASTAAVPSSFTPLVTGGDVTAPTSLGSHLTTARVDPTPVRLIIPSIRLDARIEPRGLDAKRDLDTAADPNDVAWYDRGPLPGEPGDALINGHVDWWTGDAVFTHLGRVRPGDVVEIVRADARVITFRVTVLQRVNAGTRIPALFAPGTRAQLTLITCAGVWNPLTFTNTQRLLVSASLA
jgi:LPXTG-site transpeptidase (sortase) family protein